MEKKKGLHYAWLVLIGIVVMMGFCRGGINSGLGLFLAPISNDLGYGIGSLSIMFSLSALVGIFWNPIAGKLLAKYDIRLVAGIATVVQCGSFMLLGVVSKLWGFYSFTMLMALGGAFVTQQIGPVLINKWFKEKRGLAMGVMMAGVGILGAILQPLTAKIITIYGWRNGYIFLGLVCLVLVLPITIILFRNSPEERGMKAFGDTGEDEKQGNTKQTAAQQAPEIPGITCARALKSPAFYFIFFFMFFLCGILSFGSHVPTMGVESGYTTEIGGLGMSFWLIGTTVGSLVFGSLTDKIGAKKTTLMALGCGILAVVLLIFLRQQIVFFFFALFCYGFLSSSLGVLGPLIVGAIFGHKEFGQIFGFILIAVNVASMILVPAYGFVYDAFNSYQYVFYMILAFLLICTGCLVMAYKTGKTIQLEWQKQ